MALRNICRGGDLNEDISMANNYCTKWLNYSVIGINTFNYVLMFLKKFKRDMKFVHLIS